MSINQRLKAMLEMEEISQKHFCEVTGMDEKTVSNIKTGKTKMPKLDFFEAIANHFPDHLFWLITGKREYLPEGKGEVMMLREPSSEYQKTEPQLADLLRTVQQQSEAIARLTMLLNGLPSIVERLERIEEKVGMKGAE